MFRLRTIRRVLLCCAVVTGAVSDSIGSEKKSPSNAPVSSAASDTSGDRAAVADNATAVGEGANANNGKSEQVMPAGTLAELRSLGAQRSRYRQAAGESSADTIHSVKPELKTFESTIRPILTQHCIDCHGPDEAEGNVRIDTLDPDLFSGADSDWWSEIFSVITRSEMPPPDSGEMNPGDRQKLVDWLSGELQRASIMRRGANDYSSFRRLTRYEYNYALQDILGLPWDFAKDLPPESHSEEGFQNNSQQLHMSVSQFQIYHRVARRALQRATVTGDRPPVKYWNMPMRDAAAREWEKQMEQVDKTREKLKDEPDKLEQQLLQLRKQFHRTHKTAYFRESSSERTALATWHYSNAKYAFAPQDQAGEFPRTFDCVAILPAGRQQKMVFELGNQLPDEGTMRVTARVAKTDAGGIPASLQLLFGWQASNEGRALMRVSHEDTSVTAGPQQWQIAQWDVPLGEIYPRNSVRKTAPMGGIPSPSEYVRIVNSSASEADVQLDFVRIAAPVYDQWPPESHRRIFADSDHRLDESVHAREILTDFMPRAWSRPVSDDELDRKLHLFARMRAECETFQEAILEVLATVLSSPQFLYVSTETRVEPNGDAESATDASVTQQSVPERQFLSPHEFATRLSLLLWCSVPDDELLALANEGRLTDSVVLSQQVQRMLADPRSGRFAEHFVHQWLDLQLLDFLNFKQHIKGFDPLLKEAMLREPIAFFEQVLRTNGSVLDFLHADYAMVNERLARHYGIEGVRGNHFRRVSLDGEYQRGGLLTQAGLLAMNSDWPDSNPLKRAIWILESILGDPPPPPPPAVPQIDLANPEIAKMTLKERIEDHRNHAACMSCHVKIDPWGIAFENYGALGQWRDEINGKPVEASSDLFNHQTLDGMEGLKRFLLEHRQDQYVRAMIQKMATYALGRTLSFADRADIDAITAQVRQHGDGLQTALTALMTSELFRSK